MTDAATRPETTARVAHGAALALRELGYALLAEAPLGDGRRADVLALSGAGEFLIVEVKSGRDDFKSDAKWPFYAAYCDALFFAVAPEFPLDLLPDWPGLIVADGFGGAIVRDAPRRPMPPARRRAMTLRFARLAAQRLARQGPTDL